MSSFIVLKFFGGPCMLTVQKLFMLIITVNIIEINILPSIQICTFHAFYDLIMIDRILQG